MSVLLDVLRDLCLGIIGVVKGIAEFDRQMRKFCQRPTKESPYHFCKEDE